MKFIPYGHQSIDGDDIESVVSTLRGDWLTTGPKVPEFERTLCTFTGAKEAIAVNSGTSALDIAIQSLDLPRGSEVITTAFTFAATSNALLYNGLKPVYADIEKDTRNISPSDIKQKITRKTRAIIFVDYAGHPCDIDVIRNISTECNLTLIEDACHALGASYKGRMIGSLADLTVFSFHPVKAITTGEGGAVLTGNAVIAEKLRALRTHGIEKNTNTQFDDNAGWAYDMVYLGRNYRMTDIQAALGISQMNKLTAFVKKRNALARLYNELFEPKTIFETPIIKQEVTHAWHLYTVLCQGFLRNKMYTFLKNHGIGANVHYIPTYRFSYYKKYLPIDPSGYPITEDVFNRIITLPLHPEMTEEDVHYIVDCCRLAIKEIG